MPPRPVLSARGHARLSGCGQRRLRTTAGRGQGAGAGGGGKDGGGYGARGPVRGTAGARTASRRSCGVAERRGWRRGRRLSPEAGAGAGLCWLPPGSGRRLLPAEQRPGALCALPAFAAESACCLRSKAACPELPQALRAPPQGMDLLERVRKRPVGMGRGLEHLSNAEGLGELYSFSLEKGRL